MQPNSFTFNDALTSDSSETKKMSRSRKEIFLKIILAISIVVFMIEVIWFVCITPWMPLSSIEINGIPNIERDFILRHAGITNQTSFFSVSSRSMENALEELFLVESAEVVKQFPSKIYIKLNPRIPVAFSLSSVNGKSTPLFIDRHGVICKIGINDSESKVQASLLPIVSGLIFDEAALGMRLPVSMKKIFESIEQINLNNPILLSSLSEIQIQEKLYGGFELILYPIGSNVKVRTGSELNEDTLKYMMLVIDVLKETGSEVDEIDFRTGIASYKTKETLNG
jgi:cell division protein FtsQ